MSFTLPSDLLARFLNSTRDGYAIFDAADHLIYCNEAFADIMYFDMSAQTGCTWENLVRQAFANKRGIKFDTSNVEDWLKSAKKQRRKREFRIFEVDLVDGRWMLFSEQMLNSGELLITTKNMTRQKMLESQLLSSVSELKELASTDGLTKLLNRRAFRTRVDREIENITSYNQDSALIVLDLDHFKQVNDKYGHAAGDEVLKEIARRIRATVRPHDLVGRIGGEEFAVFLCCVDQGECFTVAERIRLAIESEPVQLQSDDSTSEPNHSGTSSSKAITVTASLGLVRAHAQTPFETLYPLADAAMYQAKANGRNQVVLGDSD